MIVPLVLAAGLVPPDPAPLRSALERCDKGAIAALTALEPKRRAAFSGAVYDEQRALAEERARLDAIMPGSDAAPPALTPPTAAIAPSASSGAERARAAIDARQRRLDDARLVERAWRESLEDGRAAFLAQCTNRRDGGQP